MDPKATSTQRISSAAAAADGGQKGTPDDRKDAPSSGGKGSGHKGAGEGTTERPERKSGQLPTSRELTGKPVSRASKSAGVGDREVIDMSADTKSPSNPAAAPSNGGKQSVPSLREGGASGGKVGGSGGGTTQGAKTAAKDSKDSEDKAAEARSDAGKRPSGSSAAASEASDRKLPTPPPARGGERGRASGTPPIEHAKATNGSREGRSASAAAPRGRKGSSRTHASGEGGDKPDSSTAEPVAVQIRSETTNPTTAKEAPKGAAAKGLPGPPGEPPGPPAEMPGPPGKPIPGPPAGGRRTTPGAAENGAAANAGTAPNAVAGAGGTRGTAPTASSKSDREGTGEATQGAAAPQTGGARPAATKGASKGPAPAGGGDGSASVATGEARRGASVDAKRGIRGAGDATGGSKAPAQVSMTVRRCAASWSLF